MAEDYEGQIKQLELKMSGMVEGWMATYGDMVTLLMALFVILFSMATIDVQKFKELAISLKGTLGVLDGGERVFMPGDVPKPDPVSGQPVPSNQMAQAMPAPSKEGGPDRGAEGQKAQPQSYQTGAGEVIVLPRVTTFDRGSYELNDEQKQYLKQFVPIIKYYKNNVVAVVGHADPGPIGRIVTSDGNVMVSNWQLAANRARAVIEHFVNEREIDEKRFSLEAYSYMRKPIGKSQMGDYRRVDMIFRPKFNPNEIDLKQFSSIIEAN